MDLQPALYKKLGITIVRFRQVDGLHLTCDGEPLTSVGFFPCTRALQVDNGNLYYFDAKYWNDEEWDSLSAGKKVKLESAEDCIFICHFGTLVPDDPTIATVVQLEEIFITPFLTKPVYRRIEMERQRIERWYLQNRGAALVGQRRILAHPARMTGDLWHIILALYIDPSVELALCYHTDATDEERLNGKALSDLAKQVIPHLGERIIEVRDAIAGEIDNKIAVSMVINYFYKLFFPANPPPEMLPIRQVCIASTMVSTSRIVFACAARDYNSTLTRMRSCFLLSQEKAQADLSYKSNVELLFKNMQRTINPKDTMIKNCEGVVFINMRAAGAGQNTQHNISKAIFEKIYAACERKNLLLIRVGSPETRKTEYQWVNDPAFQNTLLLDIYGDQLKQGDELWPLYDAMFRDKRLQPKFWDLVHKFFSEKLKKKIVGFIGGRSGGMDIANFTGMRIASYDKFDPSDIHYLRLHWASVFNASVIALNAGDIDDGALELWLDGHNIIPVLPRGTLPTIPQTEDIAYNPGRLVSVERPLNPDGPVQFVPVLTLRQDRAIPDLNLLGDHLSRMLVFPPTNQDGQNL